MNMPTRFALNALLPPLIGAFFVAVYETAMHGSTLAELPLTTVAVALYTWIIAALPSALHAILMEIVYRYASPRSIHAVLWSTLSGFFAGVFLGYLILPAFIIPPSAFYPIIGLLTGGLLGGLLALTERRFSQKPITA